MANTAASTLITRALDYISRASTGTTRSGQTMENMAMSWLNAAMMRISKMHDFREMYKQYSMDTSDGVKGYTFPTNWKVILDMRMMDGTNSRKLRMESPEFLDKYRPYPEGDSEDISYTYIPFGNDFDVYPIPDATYAMYCKCITWPAVIAATATLIDYEPNKDDVILAYMLSDAFNFLQLLTDAAKWETTAKARLAEAYKVDTRKPDWNPVAQGFSSVPGEYFAEDRYDATAEEWIVNPFIFRSR